MAASWPGRGIGHAAGLAAETVSVIGKGSSEEMPQSNARLGRDAKAGPPGGAGRHRAAELPAQVTLTSLHSR
jgi:hypothetical protein